MAGPSEALLDISPEANVSNAEMALLSRRTNIAKAAWQLEDAMQDRHVGAYPWQSEARELHLRCAAAEIWTNWALVLMIFLTIFETPSWCRTETNFWTYMDPEERCRIEGVSPDKVFLSNLPYIPPGIGCIIELLIMATITKQKLLEAQMHVRFFSGLKDLSGELPRKVMYKNTRTCFNHACLVMVLVELIDIVSFVVLRPNWRFAFVPRTAYFFLVLQSMHCLMECILNVVAEFVSIAVFYVFAIILFAWISLELFKNEVGEIWGEPINKGLDGVRNTLSTMFVAGSTDDFVACFLPTYTAYHVTGILWFFYLVIAWALLNLVLDTLVAAYVEYSEGQEEDQTKTMASGIEGAFQVLADEEGTPDKDKLSKVIFTEWAQEYSKSKMARPIKDRDADIIFDCVDADASGYITKGEFCRVCRCLQYEFFETVEISPVAIEFPFLWDKVFKHFKKYVDDGQFDNFMQFVLLINFGLVVHESVWDELYNFETAFMQKLELIFSLIYVNEVALKLCVLSFEEYWIQASNRFDFITTWLLLSTSVADELASESNFASIKRYMNILRTLRLLRVLKQLKSLPSVQMMVETIIKILLESSDILKLLGVVIFFFSSLGVNLWGGLLYKGNPRIEESEYVEKEYYALNFNDFASAFGIWMVSLICSYVQEFPDALAKASNHQYHSWQMAIFLTYYVLGVMIAFELWKSLTIEVYLKMKEEAREKGDEDDEEEATWKRFEEKCKPNKFHKRLVGGRLEMINKTLEKIEEEEKEREEQERSMKEGEEHGH